MKEYKLCYSEMRKAVKQAYKKAHDLDSSLRYPIYIVHNEIEETELEVSSEPLHDNFCSPDLIEFCVKINGWCIENIQDIKEQYNDYCKEAKEENRFTYEEFRESQADFYISDRLDSDFWYDEALEVYSEGVYFPGLIDVKIEII